MPKHSIYKITNLENNHAYIGRTKNINRRFRDHEKCSSSRYLRNAVKKYGWDFFKKEVLEIVDSLEEAILAEEKYIFKFKTLAPMGYNLTASTRGPGTLSKDSIEKLSEGRQKAAYKSKSEFRGVGKKRNGSYFSARIGKGKERYERCFSSEIEAAQAYDKMALYLYGPTANLNFLESLDSYLREDLVDFFNFFTSKKKKSSKYKNVHWDKTTQKWKAYVYIKDKFKSVGLFETEEEAAKAVRIFRETGLTYYKYKKKTLNKLNIFS